MQTKREIFAEKINIRIALTIQAQEVSVTIYIRIALHINSIGHENENKNCKNFWRLETQLMKVRLGACKCAVYTGYTLEENSPALTVNKSNVGITYTHNNLVVTTHGNSCAQDKY